MPDDIVELVSGGVSLLAGTCSNALLPECVRCVGLRVWPGACRLTVLLPKATSETAAAHLRENGRLALTASQIPTHRTIQVKGRVVAIRDGADDDRALSERYLPMLRKSLAYIGLPEGITRNITSWPVWAVDLKIEHVFAQTPGPVAGARMPLQDGP